MEKKRVYPVSVTAIFLKKSEKSEKNSLPGFRDTLTRFPRFENENYPVSETSINGCLMNYVDPRE